MKLQRSPIISVAVSSIGKTSAFFLLNVCLTATFGFTGQFDRDPIVETQTKPVLVTEETLKGEARAGAPLPTFRLVDDTAEFYVQDPMEQVAEEKKKKWKWWLFPPKDSHEESNDESNLTDYRE